MGNYTISVWARSVGSTASWETAKETPFTLSSPPPCTSVNVTTSAPSPQQPGVAVTFTPVAAGCTTPEYRFWILAPGGNWLMAARLGCRRLDLEHGWQPARQLHDLRLGSRRRQRRELGDGQGDAVQPAVSNGLI